MRNATRFIASALLLVATVSAQAFVAIPVVNVSLAPSSQGAAIGDELQLQILGDYIGPATLLAGAVDLSFDPAALSITSVSVAAGLGDVAKSNGSIDNAGGHVTEIGFASFAGVSGPFVMATIQLKVLGAGLTQLQLSDAGSAELVWVNSDFAANIFGDTVFPQFSGASIDVSAVPLPLPAAMLGSALLGLLAATRRRAA